MRDNFECQFYLQIYNTWMTLVFLGVGEKKKFLGVQKCECPVHVQPITDTLHHCVLMWLMTQIHSVFQPTAHFQSSVSCPRVESLENHGCSPVINHKIPPCLTWELQGVIMVLFSTALLMECWLPNTKNLGETVQLKQMRCSLVN